MSTASQEGPGLAKVYPGLRLFGMLNSLSDPSPNPAPISFLTQIAHLALHRRACSRKTLRAVPSLGPEPPPAPIRRGSQAPSTAERGRAELIPQRSDYFVKKLDIVRTEVVIVRGDDGAVYAFHNMCSQRAIR